MVIHGGTIMKRLADAFDWFFNKLLPKKFIVFMVATIIVFKETIVPEHYWYILMVYIGGNTLSKMIKAFKEK